MGHKESIDSAQRKYVQQLFYAADSYYWMALVEAPLNPEEALEGTAQAIIGTMSVAAELFVKAFLAHQNPILVMDNPAPRLVAYCTCPESLPTTFRSGALLLNMLEGQAKTRDYPACLALLYEFLPEVREELGFALDRLPRYRNAAIHSASPEQMRYILSLVAWTVVSLRHALEATGFRGGTPESTEFMEQEQAVLSAYKRDLVVRVDQKTRQAHARFSEHTGEPLVVTACDPTTQQPCECPVCGSPALLIGEVSAEYDIDLVAEDYGLPPDPLLPPIAGEFHVTGLRCPTCRLELEGPQEAEALGLPRQLDVTGDLATWWALRGDETTEELLRGDWEGGQFIDDLDSIR